MPNAGAILKSGVDSDLLPGVAADAGYDCVFSTTRGEFHYELRNYSGIAQISALQKDWRALESVSSEGFDYFQTFDWCHGWCKEFTQQDENNSSSSIPSVYALFANNKAVMIWPLMKVRSRNGLSFLETLSMPLGQYSNLLFEKDFVDAGLARQVWETIKGSSGVDAVSLTNYPANCFMAEVLKDEGVEEIVEQVSSILDFSGIESWESYFASLSKSQRKERNRKLKKLEAMGSLTFEVHFHDGEMFSELVKTAVDMKREWLRVTSRHSQALFEQESKKFLSALTLLDAESSSGEGPVVQSLNLDGAPIAIELGMLRNRHYYSYLGAINLDWADYSPGKVQIEMSQKWALENGVEKFDFLSDPSDYKKSWSNLWVPVKTRYFSVTARGWLYCSLWKAQLRPLLRNAYQRSNPNMRKHVNRLLGLTSKS
ncbi:MAG: GNAT family N-acetyltransferase [Pseudomonadota bacterium]